MSDTIRIMLVDDHTVVREGLRALLEENGDLRVVGECGNGDEAARMAPDLKPDVILIDLKMPGMSAAAAIRQIKRETPATHVMVFTSYADDTQLRETLEAGAVGILLKDALGDELVRSVRAIARGESRLHVNQQQLDQLLQPAAPSPLAKLTARELDVLALLGKGRSNKQVGNELALTEGTVKGYVSNLLAKLELADRTQAALFANQHLPPAQADPKHP